MAKRNDPAERKGFVPAVWPSFGDRPENWPAALMMAPFTMTMASCKYWAEMSEDWWKMVFSPTRFHDHESHHQLEVPDPIEDEGEHDLFA